VGPTFALVILMFVVIAASIIGSLLLVRGWKWPLALFAIYVIALLYVSMSPQVIEGQMNRAAVGLGWVALVLAGIVAFVVKRRSSR
jgi:hypothetical protein